MGVLKGKWIGKELCPLIQPEEKQSRLYICWPTTSACNESLLQETITHNVCLLDAAVVDAHAMCVEGARNSDRLLFSALSV